MDKPFASDTAGDDSELCGGPVKDCCMYKYKSVNKQMRLKAREKTQHRSLPGWLEENDPAG
jgi:hypothetical protein